jgi:hypothetical protein
MFKSEILMELCIITKSSKWLPKIVRFIMTKLFDMKLEVLLEGQTKSFKRTSNLRAVIRYEIRMLGKLGFWKIFSEIFTRTKICPEYCRRHFVTVHVMTAKRSTSIADRLCQTLID